MYLPSRCALVFLPAEATNAGTDMRRPTDPVPVPASGEQRDTVTTVAQLVLRDAAPQELMIFNDVAEEYFTDPSAVLAPPERDEAVGFGLDIALLTPYVLAVTAVVVQFVGTLVAEVVREEAKPRLAQIVRRLFTRDEESDDVAAAEADPLDPAEVNEVRAIAFDHATALGLDDQRAQMLADAIAGRLLRAT